MGINFNGVLKKIYFFKFFLTPYFSSDGEATIYRYLPHTITNWVTNTFCVSPSEGPGIAASSELTVFQPFFMDVLVPYSIKRRELLYLQVIVFNYLNYSIPVRFLFFFFNLREVPNENVTDKDEIWQYSGPRT